MGFLIPQFYQEDAYIIQKSCLTLRAHHNWSSNQSKNSTEELNRMNYV